MLVVIGPSASGKTQIVNHLIQDYGFHKLVTYTTRPMRVGEVQDIDYHFISQASFEEKYQQHFFLETVYYNQNYYGTAYSDLSEDKVVIIEKEGLKKYIAHAREKIVIIFIRCSKPIRRLRMVGRLDEPDCIEKRLQSDDVVFDEELLSLVDYVIETSNSNVYDCAKLAYTYYQQAIGGSR